MAGLSEIVWSHSGDGQDERGPRTESLWLRSRTYGEGNRPAEEYCMIMFLYIWSLLGSLAKSLFRSAVLFSPPFFQAQWGLRGWLDYGHVRDEKMAPACAGTELRSLTQWWIQVLSLMPDLGLPPPPLRSTWEEVETEQWLAWGHFCPNNNVLDRPLSSSSDGHVGVAPPPCKVSPVQGTKKPETNVANTTQTGPIFLDL